MRLPCLSYQSFIIAASACLLTGCMVGPDFHSPDAPKTDSYTRSPLPSKTVRAGAGEAKKAQHFVGHANIPDDWYKIFHSKELNRLIQIALYNSPNLAAAKAALIQAQENWNAQIGSTMLPAISTNIGGSRQRISGLSFGGSAISSIFNVFNVTLNASYTLDVFGGLRRQIEAMGAQVDYQQYELETVYLTLSANIVTTAIAIASYREQIKATFELIEEQRKQLSIIEQQFHLGGADQTNVLTQRTTLAQTEATLPPLRQLLSQNIHALAVLVGKLPSEIDIPKFDLTRFVLPIDLPVSIPSSLVRHRPDIRASEAYLHVASANVGVATANLYPQFNFLADYGWQAPTGGTLFRTTTSTWSWGGSLTAPIFSGESLMAKKRASVAAYQQAFAQYRQIILQAFQNVADTLRALEHDAQNLRAQIKAETSSFRALQIAQTQYRLGGVSYLSLLTAMQQYQQTRIARIKAEAARYTDTAALFQALGGGWWNRASLDCSCELSHNLKQYQLGGKME